MINPIHSSHTKKGMKISLISIIASIFLSFLKLMTGIIGKSSALVSDGANSLSDVVSYTVVMGGLVASDRKADSTHQYGHEKLESLVSVLLAIAIFVTGIGIGYSGIKNMRQVDSLAIPTLLPLFGALISIIIKIILWRLTVRAVKQTELNSLRALVADHITDVFSSSGALIGVVGARLGLPILDPIASVLIAALIIKSSMEVFKAAYRVLMDSAIDKTTRLQIEEAILLNEQVKRIDLLRTRSAGNGFWVEVELCCCQNLRLSEAHDVAQEIHDRIEHDFPQVRHIMIHLNPCSGEEEFCDSCNNR
ncbi:MAG: cation diffusion facilitator family transporter [Sphaerochaetaceae bacterium]|nr:cation diffusion facilitator family transporter [Sphaerochaetaceae bacterium]MDD4219883.1 cation diffusion facilitator family transporter [Sphaerochaetaceae bacterium]